MITDLLGGQITIGIPSIDVAAKSEKLMISLARDPVATDLMRSVGAEPVFGSSDEFARSVRE